MSRHLPPSAGIVLACLIATAGCSDSPTAPTNGATTSTTITSPVRLSFAGAVGPGGSVSRAFIAQVPGTAKAVVTAISPATALTIGLGVPRADGSGCLLAYSSTATGGAAAEASGTVAVGTFCVQVFAPVASANAVNFTVALEHP